MTDKLFSLSLNPNRQVNIQSKSRVLLLMVLFALAVGGIPNVYAQHPDTLLTIDDHFIATDGLQFARQRTGSHFEYIGLHPTQWQLKEERPARFPADSTGWFYLQIRNMHSVDRSLKLNFRNVMLTKARLFVLLNGQIDSSLVTGYDIRANQRAGYDRDMSVPLLVPHGQTVEVYISVLRRAMPNAVMLDVVNAESGDGSEWEILALAATIGFCLLLWLTALVLTVYRKTKENFYYLIYATGGTLYLIAANGFGSLYLWPNAPWFQETAPVFFLTAGLAGFILLARHVLQIPVLFQKTDAFLLFSIIAGFVLVVSGWAMSLGGIPPGWYVPIALIVGLNTAISMTLILVIAMQKALDKRQQAYWWFAGIFANLYLLSLGGLALEAGLLPMKHALTTSATILAVPLEMFLTQVFIATRMLGMLKAQQQRGIELLGEKEALAIEKGEQKRLYANMLHELIKGEVQSVLAEVKEEGPVKDQLRELVQTCELGQSFVYQGDDDLFDLMKGMEFIFSSRLHSETNERYFYCDIDPALKGITLNYRQRYELIFFLRECLNNIRKHSRYQYAGLKIYRDATRSEPGAVVLEISDDGVGLHSMPGIAAAHIEIGRDNFKQYYETYLQPGHHSGIKGLFDKAERLPAELTLRSAPGEGTVVRLRFFPNSG